MKRLNLVEKAFILKRTTIFGSLDLDLLLAIADKLGLASFSEGEMIFPYNQEANKMYIIAKGSVQIKDAEDNPLEMLYVADFFGEEALFNEKPRAYSAISETDTLLLTLARTHLSTILSECPSVALGLLQEYASRFPCRAFRKSQGVS
jgi:signal-transduction protein with cAMP-binding, CBS, and nucleotidyltransferase domain